MLQMLTHHRHFILLLSCLCLLTHTELKAQGASAQLDHFSLQTLPRQVQLDVTLSAGFTCNGIQILRSADSLQFETIGLFGGVCGDSSESVSYRFIDEQPLLNQRSYYTLLLGGRIPTEILSIVVDDFGKQLFRFGPNPADAEVRLRYRNEQQQLFRVELLGLNGLPLRIETSQTEEITLPTADLPAGLYLIRLMNLDTGEQQSERLFIGR